MVDKTEDTIKTQNVKPGTAAAAMDIPLPDPQDLSWGEKYKAKAYHFVRDVLVNYFINFMGAASITYLFDVKLGQWYESFVKRFTEKSRNPKFLEFVIGFMTKTQLLLCGGHILQPFLKWMKDHRKRLEFRVGHVLDLLQEMLGRGNSASKRSIEEYNRVSELVAIGDHNRKERDALPVPELSKQDKELLVKNHVNEQLQFTDKQQSWGRVITARLTGVICTTLLSIGLAFTKTDTKPGQKPPFYDFRGRWEKPWGKVLGDNIISRIPLVKKVFNNPAPKGPMHDVTGHQLIGEYFIDDAIYTAASKLGFDRMERYLDRKEAAEEASEKAEEKHDVLKSATVLARQKKLEEAPKNFRTRREQELQNASPSLSPAVS